MLFRDRYDRTCNYELYVEHEPYEPVEPTFVRVVPDRQQHLHLVEGALSDDGDDEDQRQNHGASVLADPL